MSQSATPDSLERAAARKLIYRLAELDGVEMDAGDTNLVEAANRAVEQVNDLAERLDDVESKLAELDARAPTPSQKDYQSLGRNEKVTILRQKLTELAENTNGKAAMNYNDVIQAFDGHPSAGHAYDLMEAAAEADGYHYGENRGGEKRLAVNLDKTTA